MDFGQFFEAAIVQISLKWIIGLRPSAGYGSVGATGCI